MTYCSKLILIPAVAIAAILLLPAFAFAQTPPAPATAPPAVALPAIPPAQKVPEAKAPILPAPAETTAAPIVPAPLAEPNAVAAPPAAFSLTLPRDLSPWGMFLAADIVVKAVMVGLAFASLLTWTIWFAKAFELLAARRQLRRAIEALNEARSIADAMTRLNDRGGDVAALLRATETELRLSADAISAEGVKERIASRLERIEAAAGRRMIRGTGILATVGATAPFVGLFGTVWGIMNSFIGISKAAHHQSRCGGPWHRRSVAGNGLGPGCGHSSGGDVQHVLALDRWLSRTTGRCRRRDPAFGEPRPRPGRV